MCCACIFRQFKTCTIGKSNIFSYSRKYSSGISRIETAMMESRTVYLYTTDRSRSIIQEEESQRDKPLKACACSLASGNIIAEINFAINNVCQVSSNSSRSKGHG